MGRNRALYIYYAAADLAGGGAQVQCTCWRVAVNTDETSSPAVHLLLCSPVPEVGDLSYGPLYKTSQFLHDQDQESYFLRPHLLFTFSSLISYQRSSSYPAYCQHEKPQLWLHIIPSKTVYNQDIPGLFSLWVKK